MAKKKGRAGGPAGGSGDSGVRCTGCKGTGWVEFKVTKQVAVRGPGGKGVVGYRETTGVTNEKCGNCDGTGWV